MKEDLNNTTIYQHFVIHHNHIFENDQAGDCTNIDALFTVHFFSIKKIDLFIFSPEKV